MLSSAISYLCSRRGAASRGSTDDDDDDNDNDNHDDNDVDDDEVEAESSVHSREADAMVLRATYGPPRPKRPLAVDDYGAEGIGRRGKSESIELIAGHARTDRIVAVVRREVGYDSMFVWRAWSASTGEESLTCVMEPFLGGYYCYYNARDLVFSPDGSCVACAFLHGVCVWNFTTHRSYVVSGSQTLTKMDEILAVAWDPSGAQLAIGYKKGRICFHRVAAIRDAVDDGTDADSLKMAHERNRWDRSFATARANDFSVTTLVSHPSKPWLASASADEVVRVWHWGRSECFRELDGAHPWGNIALAATETWIVSGSSKGTLRFWPWELSTGACACTVDSAVTKLWWSQSIAWHGSTFAVAGYDEHENCSVVRVWDDVLAPRDLLSAPSVVLAQPAQASSGVVVLDDGSIVFANSRADRSGEVGRKLEKVRGPFESSEPLLWAARRVKETTAVAAAAAAAAAAAGTATTTTSTKAQQLHKRARRADTDTDEEGSLATTATTTAVAPDGDCADAETHNHKVRVLILD